MDVYHYTICDCTYEQVYEYSRAAATNIGATAVFLSISSGDHLLGVASVRLKTIPFLGRGIAYVSAGPLTRDGSADSWSEARIRAVLGALKRKLVDEEGHIFRVRLPLLPPIPDFDFDPMFAEMGFRPTNRFRTYRTLVIDLRQEIAELRKRLNGHWRTHLNYANRAGLSVDIGTGEDMSVRFRKLFDQMHGRKNLR